MEIKLLYAICLDGRVIEVRVSATSAFTGEYIEKVGHARCASCDTFDYMTGREIAYARAIEKAYEYFLKAHKWILANVDLKELEFKRTLNELLKIQKEYIAQKYSLALL